MYQLFLDVDLSDDEYVCGIDEVGRGPIAGPVVAAAVILPKNFQHNLLIDSKKLNAKNIKIMAEIVKNHALTYAFGIRDANFIDKNDILTATFRAMEEAYRKLTIVPSLILIDGNMKNPFIKGVKQIALVKGESKSAAIAAASIIAKDYRDILMLEYSKIYPQYAFEKHKGYGTKLHFQLLRQFGPSPIHRKSFAKVSETINYKGFFSE